MPFHHSELSKLRSGLRKFFPNNSELSRVLARLERFESKYGEQGYLNIGIVFEKALRVSSTNKRSCKMPDDVSYVQLGYQQLMPSLGYLYIRFHLKQNLTNDLLDMLTHEWPTVLKFRRSLAPWKGFGSFYTERSALPLNSPIRSCYIELEKSFKHWISSNLRISDSILNNSSLVHHWHIQNKNENLDSVRAFYNSTNVVDWLTGLGITLIRGDHYACEDALFQLSLKSNSWLPNTDHLITYQAGDTKLDPLYPHLSDLERYELKYTKNNAIETLACLFRFILKISDRLDSHRIRRSGLYTSRFGRFRRLTYLSSGLPTLASQAHVFMTEVSASSSQLKRKLASLDKFRFVLADDDISFTDAVIPALKREAKELKRRADIETEESYQLLQILNIQHSFRLQVTMAVITLVTILPIISDFAAKLLTILREGFLNVPGN